MRRALLGDVVASMKNGIYKPASEYSDEGVPCLRMYNIEAGAIAWRDVKRMRVTEEERDDYGLREGDLLVNRVNSRELVGKSAYIPASIEHSVFESKNIRVRLARDRAEPKFINYQLLARGSRHFANNAQQVVGMASISQGQLANFPIVLTEIEEQRRVVAEIEKQFSRLDEAVANLQRVKASVARYRAAVLSEAVGADQGEDHFVSVGSLLREPIVNGLSIKESATPTAVRALRLSAMTDTGFDYSDHRYLPIQPSKVDDIVVREGDFFVSRGNGSLSLVCRGTVAQTPPFPVIFPDTMMRLRFTDQAVMKWVAMLWPSRWIRAQIESRVKTTAGIYKIAQPQVASITLPLPPPDRRAEVLSEVDGRLSIVRGVEAQVEANLKRAQALRQAILAKAFGGAGADR